MPLRGQVFLFILVFVVSVASQIWALHRIKRIRGVRGRIAATRALSSRPHRCNSRPFPLTPEWGARHDRDCPTALRRSAAAREEDGGGRELECPGGGLCVLAG